MLDKGEDNDNQGGTCKEKSTLDDGEQGGGVSAGACIQSSKAPVRPPETVRDGGSKTDVEHEVRHPGRDGGCP